MPSGVSYHGPNLNVFRWMTTKSSSQMPVTIIVDDASDLRLVWPARFFTA